MSWTRMGSRNKLILVLVIPSVLFVTIVTQIAKDYAIDFLRQTQNEALAGMASQVVHLIGVYKNEITYNMLEVEEIIRREGGAGDRLYEAMNTISRVRSDFVRGVVYLDDDGPIIGHPATFWGNFSEREEALIREQASGGERGVFIWSNTIRSDIGRNGTYGPTSIVTKLVFDEHGLMIGTLAFLVDLSAFLERSAAFAGSYETQTLLYDREDRLIDHLTGMKFAPIPVLYGEEHIQTLASAQTYFDKEGVYYSMAAVDPGLGWKAFVVGDVEKLESRFQPLSRIAWAILLFGLAGFVAINISVSWWFTRPIIRLTKGIRKVAKGDFNTKLEVKQQDEFGEVALQFNQMTGMIKELIDDLQRTEEAKRHSEMQALLAQINPHFLYNTLNTIDIMIDFSPKAELHQMMNVLCRLLKYSLDSRTEVRPIADELQYIEDYLYIQSVRYSNRFAFHVSPAPDTLSGMAILKMALQPVVENAVFHGLHPLDGRRGRLDVTVHGMGDKLILTVQDDGVGMPEERLLALRAALHAAEESKDEGGIGIINVHRRIRLFYGHQYGLAIDSAVDQGTRVTITLPMGGRSSRKEGDADHE